MYISKTTIHLPKVMWKWVIKLTKFGPKVTMKPMNNIALLWSNALFIYGEKIQILNRVINKYRNAFSTIHSEWDESEILQ